MMAERGEHGDCFEKLISKKDEVCLLQMLHTFILLCEFHYTGIF